ncbi:MAG: SAM-dependent methyltransferase [Clostridia bacterium]|nr:SAM-dependent methyltransferase [Clostridia bacterium]
MKRISEIFENESIRLITFGKKRKDSQSQLTKLRIRPIIIKGNVTFQVESFKDNKAFHQNLNKEQLISYVTECLENDFLNMNLFTDQHDYTVFVNKDSSITLLKKAPTRNGELNMNHNSKKKYIIDSVDQPDFLVSLGIMDKKYQVIKNSYSKFRQINRFLEILDDDISMIESKPKVVDFCCGKGYLTLATWFYLNRIRKMDADIKGIDFKSDVIDFLNGFNYQRLSFYDMDINDYSFGDIDIAIGLHACDTATDLSIYHAVKNKAKLIMMVPCCQHELFSMIDNDLLQPLLKHGILKDKMTELLTNTLRGLALEAMGYEVKMIEFTTLEHTMKNVMIKAVYKGKKNLQSLEKYRELEAQFHVRCSVDKIFNIDNKNSN